MPDTDGLGMDQTNMNIENLPDESRHRTNETVVADWLQEYPHNTSAGVQKQAPLPQRPVGVPPQCEGLGCWEPWQLAALALGSAVVVLMLLWFAPFLAGKDS